MMFFMGSLRKLLRIDISLILFICLAGLFFWQVIFLNKIPLPADTIVGMYHPWRDVVWNGFTSGVPYKNYLITDPVRQQYVWRELVIDQMKRGILPLWNPYSFSGYPLLANFQTGAFYPLNLLYLVFSFPTAWSMEVIFQLIGSLIFLYIYLRFMEVSKVGSVISAISYSFSGFAISWMEWNTILHVALWMPLIFLSFEHLIHKITYKWTLVLIFSGIAQIFAGHLQILFYSSLISLIYLIARLARTNLDTKFSYKYFRNIIRKLIPFIFIYLVILMITSIQWIPTLKFINLSARNIDQSGYLGEGWFIPWQNLIQYVAPDFFGNPATNNYWGIWNYAEFVGYIGIIPLIFAVYALIFRFDKKTMFFGILFFLSWIFSLPTYLAKIPYIFKIPYLSSSQPTRLIFVATFSLSILSGLGYDIYKKNNSLKKMSIVLILLNILIIILWLVVLFPKHLGITIPIDYLTVSRRNLIIPSGLLIISTLLFILPLHKFISRNVLNIILLFILVLDLFRFGWKFTPFSPRNWIYPSTKLIQDVQSKEDNWRIMSLDRRIIPSNFSASYKLQDVSGYDPLYLISYNRLVSAWERDIPDITPASFNRIITPQNYNSFIADLLGVKYIYSFESIKSDKLKLLDQEGQTYLYENIKVFPRAFLVSKTIRVDNKKEEIEKLFELKDNLLNTATLNEDLQLTGEDISKEENVDILRYDEEYIKIMSQTKNRRLLILTDIYYPSWHVYIDGKENKIHEVDFILRGVAVPAGVHIIEFRNQIL